MAQRIECLRVEFPRGMDANAYALKVTPASKSLGLMLAGARWLGMGAAPNPAPAIGVEPTSLPGDKVAPTPEPAAPEPVEEEVLPLAAAAAPVNAGEIVIERGERHYKARGLEKNTGAEALKVQLRASRAGAGFHIDTLDLYAARQRQAFVRQAAEELEAKGDDIRRDLHEVLLRLEEEQQRRAERAARETAAPEPGMSARERAEALDLLRSPQLIERVLVDFARCGVAGEQSNLLAAYLAATSRRLDRPLAVVVQSSTAGGKSALMAAVLEFMPEEETIRYSALTGQALYYMGAADIKHKILAIAEEEGASRAGYALKLLQSEGVLRIAAAGKDPETGRLQTLEYTVEEPAMIFLTTTALDVDEELLNRCLVLGVNEEREQTRAIHARQRERETLAGLLQATERRELAALHRNAQRLLEPVAVVNEHARQLAFPDGRTRTRRDHAKYLTLIRAIALLHQHQRPRRRARRIDYIEATAGDIAREVLGRGMSELAPQTRRLLELLDGMVREGCKQEGVRRSEYRFTRRQAREHTGWGQTQMGAHLGRLESLEYVTAHRGGRGQTFVYELAAEVDEEGGATLLAGLIEIENCAYDGNLPGPEANLSGPNRGQIGPCRGVPESGFDRVNTASPSTLAAKEEKNAHQGHINEAVVIVAAAATAGGAR